MPPSLSSTPVMSTVRPPIPLTIPGETVGASIVSDTNTLMILVVFPAPLLASIVMSKVPLDNVVVPDMIPFARFSSIPLGRMPDLME